MGWDFHSICTANSFHDKHPSNLTLASHLPRGVQVTDHLMSHRHPSSVPGYTRLGPLAFYDYDCCACFEIDIGIGISLEYEPSPVPVGSAHQLQEGPFLRLSVAGY